MVQIDKIRQIVEEKRAQLNLSIRALAKKSGISNHSQIIRILNGKAMPTRNMLTKLCKGIEANKEERIAIFHAAGYLSPDEEVEEVQSAAA